MQFRSLMALLSSRIAIVFLGILCCAQGAQAYFIDGEGHYGLRPETQIQPGFSGQKGLNQGTFQTFRLLGRARPTDQLSFNMEFRIFENPRDAYLGDKARPEECSKLRGAASKGGADENEPRGSSNDCEGRHQDTEHPAYEGYRPYISEAYVKYGFDYCLLEAGRRGRDWGMGIFLDSGRDPFEVSASIFDGFTCGINIQKSQTLGFSIGFDKLSETGTYIDVGYPERGNRYGATKTSDDLEQFFLTIEYDDRKANAGSNFNRHIAIYFANVFGNESLEVRSGNTWEHYDAATDVKFADLYTAFYFKSFIMRNEFLFRLGRSADPSWARYGGVSSESEVQKNTVDAIGLAGDMTFILSQSGTYVGPEEFNQGNFQSHEAFLEYAYAPGDSDGYRREYEDSVNRPKKRDDVEGTKPKASAMAFHRNFSRALIFFNDRQFLDDLRIDGVFDPGRFMNASMFGLGYRFRSLQYGSIETKLITASLNETIPGDVKQAILDEEEIARACDAGENEGEECESVAREDRPIGFSGSSLGYELDVKYSRPIGRDIELGLGAALALPGEAWRTRRDDSPQLTYLLQGEAVFRF